MLRFWKCKCKFLNEEFVSNMLKAKEKNNIKYVVKSNTLKRKTTGKKTEIKSFEESLLVFHKKRKKLKLSIDLSTDTSFYKKLSSISSLF